MTYRYKHVEAVQWFRNGDHPRDNVMRPFEDTGLMPDHPREGEIVRYFRDPTVVDTKKCEKCGKKMHEHGWLEGSQYGQPIVCPGDFIVECYYGCVAMKPEEFHKMYEPVTQ